MESAGLILLIALVGIAVLWTSLLWLQQRRTNRELLELLTQNTQLLSALGAQIVAPIQKHSSELHQNLDRVLREEFHRSREEISRTSRDGREEQTRTLQTFQESIEKLRVSLDQRLNQFLTQGAEQTRLQTESQERKQEALRVAIENKLTALQTSNEKKLEEMRATVDEKLQRTLEQRLGESFKIVSDRLEQVHKGLGEMQTLALGVGDLKKVLTNVKTRGTWGEIQLGALLEQMLSPEQFEKNVALKRGSTENVEFCVRLPGKDDAGGIVYLPIDSKFPKEDYERLIHASEQGNAEAVQEASAALESEIKRCARDIRDKYINPPKTTDFAILFLPVESLYAEVLRRPGLVELLQRDYRVTLAGPTTLSALLNSLQMGFRTLAIQKRSGEVWKILGGVKTEFGRFGDILDKVNKKLQEAQNTIDDASKKTRHIERRLSTVDGLPSSESQALLGLENAPSSTPDEE